MQEYAANFRSDGSIKTHVSKINQQGLTLVEILVVFTVISILAGMGIASFVSYSRSQEVNQTANNIKLLINESKFNSLSVVKTVTSGSGQSVSCGAESLIGYRVDVSMPRTMSLVQVCSSKITTIKTITLNGTLSFTGGTTCNQLQFGTLSPNVSGAPCDIEVTGFGQSKIVNVDIGGNVSVN